MFLYAYFTSKRTNFRAIDENKESAAIFLIQAGCDMDSSRLPGPNGEGGDEVKEKASPLHLCCQWGLEAVVQVWRIHISYPDIILTIFVL